MVSLDCATGTGNPSGGKIPQAEYQRVKDEKNREFEIERTKFERDEMDFELQMKAASI